MSKIASGITEREEEKHKSACLLLGLIASSQGLKAAIQWVLRMNAELSRNILQHHVTV
jgi:hypothetical protein